MEPLVADDQYLAFGPAGIAQRKMGAEGGNLIRARCASSTCLNQRPKLLNDDRSNSPSEIG